MTGVPNTSVVNSIQVTVINVPQVHDSNICYFFGALQELTLNIKDHGNPGLQLSYQWHFNHSSGIPPL